MKVFQDINLLPFPPNLSVHVDMFVFLRYPTRAVISRTVESRFFQPPGEKDLVRITRRLKKMGCKITVFDWGREASFGSNYREFSKTESSTERLSSSFIILQPIAKAQKSYL